MRTYITQFSQPDSIIPDLTNPQALNRYSYALNNPIRYNDPSGHCVQDDNGKCKGWKYSTGYKISNWKGRIKREFGITMKNDKMNWSLANTQTAYKALNMINNELNGNLKTVVSGTTFTMTSQAQCKGREGPRDCYKGITASTGVTFYSSNSSLKIPLTNFLHETGHLMDFVPATNNVFSGSLPEKPSWVKNGYVNSELLLGKLVEPVQAKPMNEPNDPNEYWADAFANYVAGNINLDFAEGIDMATDVANALLPYVNP